MRIRAIALALPLLVGIAACKTSSTQGRGTASTGARSDDAQADAKTRGDAGPTAAGDASAANKGDTSASGSATAGTGTETGMGSGSATGSATAGTGTSSETGSVGSGSATPGTSSDTSSSTGDVYGGTGQAGTSTSPSGSTADAGSTASSGQAGSAGSDPLMVPGDPVKAHGDDQVISGKISKVSSRSVTIKSDMGDEKTLSVVPETSVMVDGREAQTAELQEGQPVRASFGEVEGKDVAVEIRAGADASGSSGSGSTGSGTPAGETTSPGMGRPEPTTGTDRDRQTPDGPSQAERQR